MNVNLGISNDAGRFPREPHLAKTSLPSETPFDPRTTLTLEYLENSSLSRAPKLGKRTHEHEFHPGYYSQGTVHSREHYSPGHPGIILIQVSLSTKGK